MLRLVHITYIPFTMAVVVVAPELTTDSPPTNGSFSSSRGLISGVGRADDTTSSTIFSIAPFAPVAPPEPPLAVTCASLRLPMVGGTTIGSGLCVGLESGVLSALLPLPAYSLGDEPLMAARLCVGPGVPAEPLGGPGPTTPAPPEPGPARVLACFRRRGRYL
uniref:Uncharacterized protein n=1 Tax=Anopheles atroparvus TaxID=41427 RepID=A0A182JFP7_ANOAO